MSITAVLLPFVAYLLSLPDSFLTTKPSQCLNISKNSHLYTARFCHYIRVHYNEGLLHMDTLKFVWALRNHSKGITQPQSIQMAIPAQNVCYFNCNTKT
jgi:hypothetical protein